MIVPMFIPTSNGHGGGPPLGPKGRAAFAIYFSGIAGSLIYHVNESVLVKDVYFNTKFTDAVVMGTIEGLAKGAIWPIGIIALPGYIYKKYKEK